VVSQGRFPEQAAAAEQVAVGQASSEDLLRSLLLEAVAVQADTRRTAAAEETVAAAPG
jgi:hypothetical protein